MMRSRLSSRPLRQIIQHTSPLQRVLAPTCQHPKRWRSSASDPPPSPSPSSTLPAESSFPPRSRNKQRQLFKEITPEDRRLLRSLPAEKQEAALKKILQKVEQKAEEEKRDALVYDTLEFLDKSPEALEAVAEQSRDFHENIWKPYRPPDIAIEGGIGLSEATLAVQRRAEEIRAANPELGRRNVRYPRAVQALYLKPLRRVPEDGVPSCDLQLRSFSVRNLEFFADFALRAAYYANLPAFGPLPLPRITERWTVPKSPFIYKKTQENFERVTFRRLIQIKDGHPDNVKLWLAFLRKHQYHGVGMKANMWEWSALDVGLQMDKNLHRNRRRVGEAWAHMGDTKQPKTVEKVAELLQEERFKLAGGR